MRRHPAVLAGAAVKYLLVLVVATLVLRFSAGVGAVETLGVAVLLAGTGWFAWKVGDWWVERFTVTDRRVLLVSGVLTRRVAIMPLRKVTDLTFERSFTGRVLGYGAFVMESAGQHQALSRVDHLPRPDSLYAQMSDLLFGRRGAGVDPDEDELDPVVGGPGGPVTPGPRGQATVRLGAPVAAGRPSRPVPPGPLAPPPPAAPQTPAVPPTTPAAQRPRAAPPTPPAPQVPGRSATAPTAPLPVVARGTTASRRPRGRGDLDERPPADPRGRRPGH